MTDAQWCKHNGNWNTGNWSQAKKGSKNPAGMQPSLSRPLCHSRQSEVQITFVRNKLSPLAALTQLPNWTNMNDALKTLLAYDYSSRGEGIYFMLDLRQRPDMRAGVDKSRGKLANMPWRPRSDADFDMFLEFIRRIFYCGPTVFFFPLLLPTAYA